MLGVPSPEHMMDWQQESGAGTMPLDDPAGSAADLRALLSSGRVSPVPDVVVRALNLNPYSAAALGVGEAVPGVGEKWLVPGMTGSGLVDFNEAGSDSEVTLNAGNVNMAGQQVQGVLGIQGLELACCVFQTLGGSQTMFPGEQVPGERVSQQHWETARAVAAAHGGLVSGILPPGAPADLEEALRVMQQLKLGDTAPFVAQVLTQRVKDRNGRWWSLRDLWLSSRYSGNTTAICQLLADPHVSPAVDLAVHWWLAVLIQSELEQGGAVPYKAWHKWVHVMCMACRSVRDYVLAKDDVMPAAGKQVDFIARVSSDGRHIALRDIIRYQWLLQGMVLAGSMILLNLNR
jgi:hypothetical protein